MRAPIIVALVTACAFISACATQGKYDWGSYEHSLYVYYKDPAKVDELTQSLQKAIAESGSGHKAVAPGLYAEYGYLLLQAGKRQDAVQAFQQEEKHWPESKYFMDHMIQVASATPGGKEP